MGRSLLGLIVLVALGCGGKSVTDESADGVGGAGDAMSSVPAQSLRGRLATYGQSGIGIELYPPAVSPSTSRLTSIEGDWHTDACDSLAFDGQGNVYALCYQAVPSEPLGQVDVFAPSATGEAKPIRTITGFEGYQTDMAVTTDGTVYTVRDGGDADTQACGGGEVEVFSPSANGDAAPARIIQGPHTEFECPAAVAVDAAGQIYVGNAEGGPILVFAADANGDAAPIRRIGALSDIGDVSAITFDAAGSIYALDVGRRPAVVIYDATAGEGSAPARVITGAATTFTLPNGIAIDDDGRILVSDEVSSSGQIDIFAPSANGNIAPDMVLPKLGGDGIAISP